MAKIFGIEIRNVKTHKGHEGEDLVQGNVYIDGKLVGYFNQADCGGQDEIVLQPSSDISNWAKKRDIIYKEIIRREEAFLRQELGQNKKASFPDGTELIYSLLYLRETEQMFKKIIKDGKRNGMITCEVDEGFKRITASFLYTGLNKKTAEDNLRKKFDGRNPNNFKFYLSFDDFVIKEKGTV